VFFAMGDVVPEPQEVAVRPVVQAAVHAGEKRLLGGLDAARIQGLGIREDVRAHVGVIDVLVRQRDVLKDR
jgi:hypothetical protein